MPIKRFHANNRMSQAVIFNNLVYLSGQVCNNETADISQQTQETLANIEHFLKEAGTDKSHILSATIYLKNIEHDFEAMNAIWDKWIPNEATPARATVQALMCEPELLIEISIVAALP